jgi:pimeloyl-ACP methyl ester carboxylesterase
MISPYHRASPIIGRAARARSRRRTLHPLQVLALAACCLTAPAAASWPEGVESTTHPGADGTPQPMMAWFPPAGRPAPLLVALHSWSADHRQVSDAYATWCMTKGWAFIHPEFRGPNRRPEAMGSELVVKDILAAVAEAQRRRAIDPDRIYLMGGSGGGYASLLMAGRAPELWAAVSAWVPIHDLRAWHAECTRAKRAYAGMMEAACGGAPGASAAVDEQYRLRSASTWLAQATGVPIDINTGIHDGHRGSVPVSHALNAFNQLAAAARRLPQADIAHLTAKQEIPPHLRAEAAADPLYGAKTVLFRRESGHVRITVFEGGHDVIFAAGLAWLEQQRRNRPVRWAVPPPSAPVLGEPAAEVGK